VSRSHALPLQLQTPALRCPCQIEQERVVDLRCRHCGNRVSNNLQVIKLPPHA
jgi:hypothetical protein